MKSKTAFSKKDLIVVLGCAVFVLMNIGAIGSGGRRRAKQAVCLSNLRKWGVIFQMFTNDNDGYFNPGKNKSGRRYYGKWQNVLAPYAGMDFKFWCCPEATKPQYEWVSGVRRSTSARQPWRANGQPSMSNDFYLVSPYAYSSFGLNAWVLNAPQSTRTTWSSSGWRPLKDFWRTPNVKGAGNIPMLLDCRSYRCWPLHTNGPPEGSTGGPIEGLHMRYFCMDRHEGSGIINGAFVDFSARKIGLKELWKLKWHRSFDINVGPTPSQFDQQSPWMKDFKDY